MKWRRRASIRGYFVAQRPSSQTTRFYCCMRQQSQTISKDNFGRFDSRPSENSWNMQALERQIADFRKRLKNERRGHANHKRKQSHTQHSTRLQKTIIKLFYDTKRLGNVHKRRGARRNGCFRNLISSRTPGSSFVITVLFKIQSWWS